MTAQAFTPEGHVSASAPQQLLLLQRGLAMDDVGLLLRHADSRTTERVYVHTKMIDVRKRMEALA